MEPTGKGAFDRARHRKGGGVSVEVAPAQAGAEAEALAIRFTLRDGARRGSPWGLLSTAPLRVSSGSRAAAVGE